MIVVDTNVVSELMKPVPDEAVRGWLVATRRDRLCTTSITIAEIRYGIARLPSGKRRTVLRSAADHFFHAFEDQILPFDAAAAAVYPDVVVRRDAAGRPIDGFDAQIAAICRSQDALLATRNLKDFTETGLTLIDPWRST
jgi:predicted nucleic acid-binding protein